MSKNPYSDLPDTSFWRRAVSASQDMIDPVIEPRFTFQASDLVATAGSCFAQHISRALVSRKFNYYISESGPAERQFGVFSARYGNIYSVRQLLQLFNRAYALFEPFDCAWRRPDGRYADPFRPQVEPGGFADPEAVIAERTRHLEAVRTMFENCNIFIFTLGLTEAWYSKRDGAVFPLAPGVVASPDHDDIIFHNFTFGEMLMDLESFVRKLRCVNPDVRILFTVSPVPLIATYERRHVLVSTIASKSTLRAVADELVRRDPGIDYFPSYEMIAAHPSGGRHYTPDLRDVTEQGVRSVMEIFCRHYLSDGAVRPPPSQIKLMRDASAREAALIALGEIICDEEAIDE